MDDYFYKQEVKRFNPVLERIAIALERIAIALETSKYVASKNNNPYEVTYNKEVKNE
jgi:hypothetical protein